MNNFYLFKNALNTHNLAEFEKGIESLNEVVANRNNRIDTLIRYEDFWTQTINHGVLYDVPAKLKNEYIGLSVKLFNSFSPIPFDIANEIEFDILYNDDCNGFAGFDFSKTAIPGNRQVIDLITFNQFKLRCSHEIGFNSIQNFWDNKEILFPHIVFCERVWDQIQHLSVTDDRFLLIREKLKKLDKFTGTWKTGAFNFKSLGLNNSPDTPNRIAKTVKLRTFNCPSIGDQVFSLHIKWSFGREFFRMYYFPNEGDRKVYIGYIGPKDDIGF